MMQLCEFCPSWAQWQMRWVEEQEKEKDEKLVPRGLKYSDGSYLCSTHKREFEHGKQTLQQIEGFSSDMDCRFFFIGARIAVN